MRMKTRAEILQLIKATIASETGISIEEIDETSTFFDLGLNSISAVYLLEVLENKLSIEMNPLFFWDYPTVAQFADYLTTLQQT